MYMFFPTAEKAEELEVSFLLNQLGLGRLAGQSVEHATRSRGGEFEPHVGVEVT